MGSKYNNSVVSKMEKKHQITKKQYILFENMNKKTSKIKTAVNGSVIRPV